VQGNGWARELIVPGAIPALDALRAFAIILVLLRHGVRPFWDSSGHVLVPLGDWDLAVPLINGWVGADLFFVLSGFLIGRQLISAKARSERGPRALVRYLLRRALRILPAYYAVLALAALGLVPYYAISPDYLGLRVAWHILLLQDYYPSNIVVVFWSLGVEEKFYLLAPIAFGFVFLLRNRFAQYTALLSLAALGLLARYLTHLAHPEPITYEAYFPTFRWPFHLCLEPLLLGLLVALLHRDWRDSPIRESFVVGNRRFEAGALLAGALFWCGCLATVAILATEPMLDVIDVKDRVWQPSLVAVAMAVWVAGAAFGAAPARLASPWLVMTAKLSYVLYLVHVMVIPGANVIVDAVLGTSDVPQLARLIIFLPIYAVCSLALGLAIHLAVERPFLKLKDRLV
jgi:peptidoglycan/LPS O-acetylase OafA/YrhL